MLEIVMSNRFKKDLRLAARRGYNFDLLDEIVNKLTRRELLPEKIRITLCPETMKAAANATLLPTGCLFTK